MLVLFLHFSGPCSDLDKLYQILLTLTSLTWSRSVHHCAVQSVLLHGDHLNYISLADKCDEDPDTLTQVTVIWSQPFSSKFYLHCIDQVWNYWEVTPSLSTSVSNEAGNNLKIPDWSHSQKQSEYFSIIHFYIWYIQNIITSNTNKSCLTSLSFYQISESLQHSFFCCKHIDIYQIFATQFIRQNAYLFFRI